MNFLDNFKSFFVLFSYFMCFLSPVSPGSGQLTCKKKYYEWYVIRSNMSEHSLDATPLATLTASNPLSAMSTLASNPTPLATLPRDIYTKQSHVFS